MLAQGVFEASQCIFEFWLIRLSESRVPKDRQTKKSPIWKFPIVRAHLAPVCSKVHTFSASALFQKFIVGKTGLLKTGLLKNRHPTTDRVFRSQLVVYQRRRGCLR
jgi:hypothetical protein